MKDYHKEIIVKPAKRLLKALKKADSLQVILLNRICKGWEAEYKFHPSRKWRFDFANPSLKTAVEIDGGCFIRGRHSRGMGQIKDMEKFNEAVILGWRVFHYTPQQSGNALRDIERLTK